MGEVGQLAPSRGLFTSRLAVSGDHRLEVFEVEVLLDARSTDDSQENFRRQRRLSLKVLIWTGFNDFIISIFLYSKRVHLPPH